MSLLLSTEGVGGDDSANYVVWHFMVVENPEKIRKDLSRLAARWPVPTYSIQALRADRGLRNIVICITSFIRYSRSYCETKDVTQ